MNYLLLALAGAMVVAGAARSAADSIPPDTNTTISVSNTNNAEEQELKKIMQDDDAAMDEVDQWIRDNNAFAAQGGGESKQGLNLRILARLQIVRTNYEGFLQRYPTNADAFLAYGSFLNDIGDEDAACAQYEISRQLNPRNPAVWNNLANYYGEHGPVTNAFAYYAKAIDLNSNEPVYYENLATTVYLFRRDAMQFYRIKEAQVFDKALALYQQAIRLDPDNFTLQTDYAESYYGIKPLRTNDALMAWTNALNIAHDETEREAVYIHLARIKIAVGRFAEAQAHLEAVTNSNYDALKNRLERTMADRKKGTPSYLTMVYTNSSLDSEIATETTNTVASTTNSTPLLTNAPSSSSQ